MTALRPATPRRESWRRYASSDWGLLVAAVGLSLIGALLVWSATHERVGVALLVRHLVNAAIGVSVALAVIRVGVRWLRAAAPWVYVAGLVGLVVVLGPLGQTVNGSRSWLFLPAGFSVQPAELAKIALLIGLAMMLAAGRDPARPPGPAEVLPAWLLGGVPVVLVLAQPDLGTAVVMVAMTVGVVAASGASWVWSLTAVLATVAGVVTALRVPLLDPYQVDRLLAFADPGRDPQGIGYQSAQVRLAIGSGGWQGAGLGQGSQTQGGFVPFQETDFIFSVAAEELGLWGAVGLIGLLLFVVLRALWVALHTDEPFARLVAVGVACWFGFQIVQNIGMNLGLLPVTGLPLPFVSYGGSSMLACWLAVGLLVSAQHDQRP